MLTTLDRNSDRVAMHDIRADVLRAQAAEIRHVGFGDLFLADLPDAVDPCGENGEFNSLSHSARCSSSRNLRNPYSLRTPPCQDYRLC